MVRQNSLGFEQEEEESSTDKSVVGVSIPPPTIKKRTLIVRKGREIVTTTDYRAIIAIMLVASFIFVVIKGDFTGIAALGPLAGAAVGYYFHWKGSERL